MTATATKAMIKTIIYIAAGSGIGGVARFLLTRVIQEHAGSAAFPWGTFAVNIIGCFAIGLIYGLLDRGFSLSPEMKAFLTVGLCGGFTTFSTFSADFIRLVRAGNHTAALLYVIVTVAICALGTLAGAKMATTLGR